MVVLRGPTVGISLGPYVRPRGGEFSYERGTPVGGGGLMSEVSLYCTGESGFRAWGLDFGVLGFRGWGLGFGVWGLG